MIFDLKGKVSIVTGTSGNLGPIWVETLKEMGSEVFEIDYPEYDVSKIDDVMDAYNDFGERFSYFPPSIIINNAAIDIPPILPIEDEPIDFWDWNRIMDVNFGGTSNICEQFIPIMMKGHGGLIINIGSIFGSVAPYWPNYPPRFEKPCAYGVSKAALKNLTKQIAVKYAQYNIRCFMLSFSAYDSGKHTMDFKGKFLKRVPLGRMLNRDDMKRALAGLVIQTYLNGQEVIIDGGYLAW